MKVQRQAQFKTWRLETISIDINKVEADEKAEIYDKLISKNRISAASHVNSKHQAGGSLSLVI